MRCTRPLRAGFQHDGNSITFRRKEMSQQFATFKLPCGKCLSCRLEYGRQWAVRCVHEASMHDRNSFVTLTYDDDHLTSPRLVYDDFQRFMKRLRKRNGGERIGYFVTGEYGEINKRPHWHCILFGFSPGDAVPKYRNFRGDQSYSSECLSDLWGQGMVEFGNVTFDSAGYCARYAAKKLVHGHDGEHDFEPISKKSSKYAIGRLWIEKYWPEVFESGIVRLSNGVKCGVPRYYERWFRENHPEEYLDYLIRVKSKVTEAAFEKEDSFWPRMHGPLQLTEDQVREKILEKKFELVQKNLKL